MSGVIATLSIWDTKHSHGCPAGTSEQCSQIQIQVNSNPSCLTNPCQSFSLSKVIYTFSIMESTTVSNEMSSTQRRFPVNKEEAINRQYLPPASFWWQILFLVEEYFKDKSTFCQTLTKVRALLHEIVFRNCHISPKKLPSFRPGRFSLIIWQSWGDLECVAFYLSMI